MSKLTFIDMFAGIGGFRSGMEQAGHRCVGWIEWDKYARQSYQAIYSTQGEYNAKDIRQVQGADLPESDVWCFGFPCQDVSVSGKQAGILNGKRSGLFFEVIRLLQERVKNKKALPSYLFIENVKNLLSIDGGWGFARVQLELYEAGYNFEWSVINSAEVVPQNRERVYIIGHLRGASTSKVFPIIRESQEVDSGTSLKIHQVGQLNKTDSFGGNPQVGRVYGTDGLSPTLNTMQGGGREPKILVRACLTPDTVDRHGVLIEAQKEYAIRKLTPKECWRLQGFTDEQFDKARNAGVSDSQLYKQSGNAVSVPVVRAIAERLG